VSTENAPDGADERSPGPTEPPGPSEPATGPLEPQGGPAESAATPPATPSTDAAGAAASRTAPADQDGTSEDDIPEPSLGAPSLAAALEAILLVTDEPVDAPTLAALVRRPSGEVDRELRELAEHYTSTGRGFDLREVAGGWRFYTRADCAEIVERYVRDGQAARLTQAALETLAVVAYRQPVSRARISAVRGVNVDGVIRTLTSRGLVSEAGHDDSSGAILYRTTELFLERLGLRTLEELPPIADYLPDIELLDDFIEQASS
jgi:segregation and condensation protein B